MLDTESHTEKLIREYTDLGLTRNQAIIHIRIRVEYDRPCKALDEAQRRSGLIKDMADAERLIKEYTDRGLNRKAAITCLRRYIGYDVESIKLIQGYIPWNPNRAHYVRPDAESKKVLDKAERKCDRVEGMTDTERLITEYMDRGITRKLAIDLAVLHGKLTEEDAETALGRLSRAKGGEGEDS